MYLPDQYTDVHESIYKKYLKTVKYILNANDSTKSH